MIEIIVLFPFFFISLQLQLSLSHVIKRSCRFKNLETQLESLVISLLNYLIDIQKTCYLSKWHVTSLLLLFINCTCCSRVQCCVHIKLTNTDASRCLLYLTSMYFEIFISSVTMGVNFGQFLRLLRLVVVLNNLRAAF